MTVNVPLAWDLRHIEAVGEHHVVVLAEEEYQAVTFHFAEGRTADTPLLLAGPLRSDPGLDATLPRINVPGAQRQTGQFVIQTDPSLRARGTALVGCRETFLERTHAWLTEQQRPLAQLAIDCPTAAYEGRIVLEPRTPRIEVRTITNVRFTDRSIEETILADFSIRDAGVAELNLLLPERLRDARFQVPMLRQKIVAPPDADPVPDGLVHVRLILQAEQIGDLRLLVLNSRGLGDGRHEAAVPVVRTGTTQASYITLEAGGRDEVVVAASENCEPLNRESVAWTYLAGMLQGGQLDQAFLVSGEATTATLALKTQRREQVETVDARIGLAEAILLLDEAGNYRGRQTFHVASGTERYLEIELPDSAQLWTAHVAGSAVKPAVPAGTRGTRQIDIPLIKTAAGDRDYEVVLHYGGSLVRAGGWSAVEVPLIRTVNVAVERSQVELRVPESLSWFDFGGTMRRTGDEGDMFANLLAYKVEQMKMFMEQIESASYVGSKRLKSDRYAEARARSNLKLLAKEAEQLARSRSDAGNESLRKLLVESGSTVEKAQQQMGGRGYGQASADATPVVIDNGLILSDRYAEQDVRVAREAVQQLGENFVVLESKQKVATETAESRRPRRERAVSGGLVPRQSAPGRFQAAAT